ncbi:Arylsulfatase [Planctomycetes bacterium CA13]|uniref:Arylsulfatase n=1 Tax=Novipirellula herctigrandis TaxID=2527986 RepID=A0A5C5ZCX4_9BACT|nr:Arylsulfatase [Planctomycetes bacterium CA13]
MGRLTVRLKAIDEYQNTLVLVLSDNGLSRTTMTDHIQLDGGGAELIKQFDNTFEHRGLPRSSVDLGPGWAYGLAAPFRLMKGYQS